MVASAPSATSVRMFALVVGSSASARPLRATATILVLFLCLRLDGLCSSERRIPALERFGRTAAPTLGHELLCLRLS